MTSRIVAAGLGAWLLSTGAMAATEKRQSDILAERWRDARRQELEAERGVIDEKIRALPHATPDTNVEISLPLRQMAAPAALTAAPMANTHTVVDDKKAETSNGDREFAGLKLGVGLSYTSDVGKLDRISDAQVVDGFVRAIDQNNGRARIMLESHYFFTPGGNPLGVPGLAWNEHDEEGKKRWGWGPFVAIQPGSGEIIDAIGAGIMFGFRRGQTSQSFNIGVGAVIDPNVRVLGDGFRENEPPPGNEMEVRFRETAQLGILILTSFSF